MTVGVVDYGMGNLRSVCNAFESLGVEPVICRSPNDLLTVSRIVLPGVGAFDQCRQNLDRFGFIEALHLNVIEKKKPFFGICLGMQMMSSVGYEDGVSEGLNWFDAETVRINEADLNLRVPHIGWNNLEYSSDCPLFKNIGKSPDVYFVHSYFVRCRNESDVKAKVWYGNEQITAAICKGNIFGSQFHPEKSQTVGLQIFENFLAWQP